MSKKIFLLDTNVLVDYYVEKQKNHQKVKEVVDFLIVNRKQGKCLLLVPNFCIAEVFATFSNLCFGEQAESNRISEEDFNKARVAFITDVSRDYEYKRYQVFNHAELNRYHLFHGHLVYQPAAEFAKKAHQRKEQLKPNGFPKFLSAFDLLVIAVGIELTHQYSKEDFAIVTSDDLMHKTCQYLANEANVTKADRIKYINIHNKPGEFENLVHFKYPNCILARDKNEILFFMQGK